MKRLFHLSTTKAQLELFDEDWEMVKSFTQSKNMQGIELGLTLDYDLDKLPEALIEGVHLSFYPMWLDFWRQDQEKLNQLFKDEAELKKYYGGLEPECLVESYKKQFERAKKLKAKYMVFHVSHVLPEDSFTWKFEYTNRDVLEATIELVNACFKEEDEGPVLLFENLWWPGLTYLDPELTKWFIEQIHYTNKGYLVDISHLILTNSKIGNEEEAYDYIKEVMDNLGETKKLIRGIHLNKALPKYYMKRDHSILLERYKHAKDSKQKNWILKNHIKAMDGHIPFDHPMAQKIVALIDPEYCVYETAPNSRHELSYFINKQDEALGLR